MFTRSQKLAACTIVGAAWIALAFVAAAAYSPPLPHGADIRADEFSAARARTILKELVGDGIPHPAESEQNAVVRERILRHFRDAGYEPQVQTATVMTLKSIAAKAVTLRNIVVRRRGSGPGRAIMLAAHYDSVPQGPGASDDGAAVSAILEIARMLHDLPPSRNDVIFLITDGEELGMLGATAFVREHPWAKDIAVAINFEARGVSGKSLMFETSDENAWLISLYARHVAFPATSSLYSEVFHRLPNDTDFTIFKKHGIAGFNFAYIRDARRYHTARDDYDSADPGSLQDHGDNAWQLLIALADFDIDSHIGGSAIYADVLGRFVLWWPASLNLALAVGVLAATFAAFTIARRRGLSRAVIWRMLAAVPITFIASLLAGGLCDLLFRFAGLSGIGWVDNSFPILLSYWVVATVTVIGVLRFTWLARTDAWSAWSGVWLNWNTMGLLVAWLVPGATYLFILHRCRRGGRSLATDADPALRRYRPCRGRCLSAVRRHLDDHGRADRADRQHRVTPIGQSGRSPR